MEIIKVFLLILFILILLVIATLTIILFISFLKYLKTSKNDKEEYYELLNRNIQENSIVLLGDSLTEFYRVDEFFHGYNIYNRGIAGDTTDGVLARLESNVIMMKPTKIFLQIGTNDLNEGKDADYVVKNIKLILTRLQEKLPDTKLYLISLYPINPKALLCSKLMVGRRKPGTIESINRQIKDYAAMIDIPFINIYPHLLDDLGNLKKEYTVEGLHISLDGYCVITKVLQKYIEE